MMSPMVDNTGYPELAGKIREAQNDLAIHPTAKLCFTIQNQFMAVLTPHEEAKLYELDWLCARGQFQTMTRFIQELDEDTLGRMLIASCSSHHVAGKPRTYTAEIHDLLESVIEAFHSKRNLAIEKATSTLRSLSYDQKKAMMITSILRWGSLDSVMFPEVDRFGKIEGSDKRESQQ